MASDLYEKLLHAGFSEEFLKSTAGAHPVSRQGLMSYPKAWRTCQHCRRLYADIDHVPDIRNRRNKPIKANGAQKTGFCSWTCAEAVFGDKAHSAIKGYFVALRPDFYLTKEWREVRYAVLHERGGRCECCGRTSKQGVVIHVDHVKPRSKYPHLALDKDNLQILCADCNLGKGARYETDWRGVA